MSNALLAIVAAVFLCDVALRPWRPFREQAFHNLFYVALAYVPLLTVPHLSANAITAVAGSLALLALLSYARMVGLTLFWRFFVPTALATLAFFVAARVHWYALFQAMPVFGIFAVVATAVMGRESEAFLQKLCLSWLGLLVYGYLWAHASLFADPDMIDRADGQLMLAIVLLLAKFADVGWLAVLRVWPGHPRGQLWTGPIAGAIGGLVVALFGYPAPGVDVLVMLGAIVGSALTIGSRSYHWVVTDVLGPAAAELRQPLKGTMLFGFSFSLALAFHWIRYRS